jgi:hypothetical protein
MNEAMLKQERAIPEGGIDDEILPELRMLYDPKWKDNRPDIKVPESVDQVVDEIEPEDAGTEGEDVGTEDTGAEGEDTTTDSKPTKTDDADTGPESEDLPDITQDEPALDDEAK